MDTFLVSNFIQRFRKELGWSQSDLARQAGLSRQLIHAVESGRSKPGIEVALRLARALTCSVEELFPLPEEWPVQAWPGLVEGRCQLARVRDQWYAIPCDAAGSFDLADGVVEQADGVLQIQPMQPLSKLPDSVVICGCDPGLAIAARMAERESQGAVRALWRNVSSTDGLRRLAAGQCHLAGVHYSDESGSLNTERVRAFGLPFEYDLIPFASWEQGIMVAAGNPKSIRRVEDLFASGCAFRQPGARLGPSQHDRDAVEGSGLGTASGAALDGAQPRGGCATGERRGRGRRAGPAGGGAFLRAWTLCRCWRGTSTLCCRATCVATHGWGFFWTRWPRCRVADRSLNCPVTQRGNVNIVKAMSSRAIDAGGAFVIKSVESIFLWLTPL